MWFETCRGNILRQLKYKWGRLKGSRGGKVSVHHLNWWNVNISKLWCYKYTYIYHVISRMTITAPCKKSMQRDTLKNTMAKSKLMISKK